MAITDKTRKALWAQSGNRCLLCRIELVQESEHENDKLIIGEECHIVSSKTNGPRGDTTFIGNYDHIDNLVLLCANDHKRIDELTDIYTVEKLKLFKLIHENWVKTTLERDVIAFTNDKNNVKSLPKITSGKRIIDIINGAHLFDFHHDELSTEKEAEIIGDLLEDLKDYGDLLSDIGYTEIAKLGLRYNDELENLKQMGFILFGIRRKIRVRNDKKEDMGLYDAASIIIVRDNNPSIVNDFLIAKFPTDFSFM